MTLLFLTGLALRLIFSFVLPLDGGDETYTLLASQKPILPLLAATLDASGPAWTLILHFLEKITTDYHFIRIVTSIIGAISILLAAKLGKTLFNENIGRLTALVFALSPTQIYYSAHSRQYSLTILTSLLIFLALSKFLKPDSKKNLVFLFAVLTFANYIHYLAVLIPISFLAYLFLFEYSSPVILTPSETRGKNLNARSFARQSRTQDDGRGKKFGKFSKVFLLSILASLPIYLAFLSVEHLPKTALPNITILKIITLPLNFTFPLNLAELTNLYPKFAINYVNILLLGLSTFAVTITFFSVLKRSGRKIIFLLITLIASNLMVIAASTVGPSIFAFRTLLIFATPLYVLLGLALASRKKLTVIYFALTAITLASTIYYFLNKPYPLEDFLKSNLKTGDILINTEFTNYTYLAYLMPRLQHKAAVDTLYKTAADKRLFDYYPVDSNTLIGKTFWLLEQPTEIHKTMVFEFKSKLSKTHQIVLTKSFDDMILYNYHPKN